MDWLFIQEKWILSPSHTPFKEVNFKWVEDINIIAKTIKFQKNTQDKMWSWNMVFLTRNQKDDKTKEKVSPSPGAPHCGLALQVSGYWRSVTGELAEWASCTSTWSAEKRNNNGFPLAWISQSNEGHVKHPSAATGPWKKRRSHWKRVNLSRHENVELKPLQFKDSFTGKSRAQMSGRQLWPQPRGLQGAGADLRAACVYISLFHTLLRKSGWPCRGYCTWKSAPSRTSAKWNYDNRSLTPLLVDLSLLATQNIYWKTVKSNSINTNT
jgi:hypothetical protein